MSKMECWVITGPTACGKSDLALQIAQKNGCEIVCMDSMQIYRGMDIGTAKPTLDEQALIPHHMLDIVEPDAPFSVVDYRKMALHAIEEIISRGHIPLLVGGTGFYLRALTHPMSMGNVAADPAVRNKLEYEAAIPGGKKVLHQRLEALDPITADRLHENDVRRVIRALEVCLLTGIPFSQQTQPEEESPLHCRCICLNMERETLYRRIHLRVDRMMENGLLHEVESLLDRNIDPSAQSMQGIGYKELIAALQGACTLTDAVDQIKMNTRHYAKRQLTWMRREEGLYWLERDENMFQKAQSYFEEETEFGR